MTEPVAARVEIGEASRLLALYAEGSEDAEVAAVKLTLEMIAETASWLEMGNPAAAELVRQWWINQVKLGVGAEDAEEFDQRWSLAFENAAKLKAAIKTHAEKTLDAAEAEPKSRFASALNNQIECKAEERAMPWPDAARAPDNAVGIERLTYPVGLLGHVVQYIVDTNRLPDRLLALAGALLACAKALDRKVIGPGDISVVLFLLVIAESGAGKQHIINCIRILLRAMGVEDAIVGTGIASVQSIDEILEGQGKEGKGGRPSALVIIDEYGSFLTRIASKGQTGNVSEIPAKLQTLWGWSPEMEYIGDTKVGKGADRLKVYGPAFSIFGASTEHSFFAALKKKNVSGGFVNRHFLLNAGRGALKPVEPKYKWLQCPAWLLKALKEVAGEAAPNDNRPLKLKDGSKEATLRDFRRIGWGPGAYDMIYDFECETRAMPSVEDREVWIRAPEIALRLATVLAVFRGSAVVDASDLTWGIELARHSTRFLTKGMSKHMLEEYEQADLVEHIREEFRRRVITPMPNADRGVLTQGQIRKYCERKCDDHRKIDAAIYHLEVCEDIIEVEKEEVRAGKPTRRWKWNGAAPKA